VASPPVERTDLLADDDAQLALTCCCEMPYGGLGGVGDGEHDTGLHDALLGGVGSPCRAAAA
jgi:hypothetical protein